MSWGDTPTVELTGTVEVDTDALEAAVVSTNTRLGEVQASPTANTVLDRLKALLTGIVLAAGSAVVGKVGIDQTTPGTTDRVTSATGALIVVEKTRPANATPFTLNDAIGDTTNWAFPNAVRWAGGSGVIVSAIVATDDLVGVATLELDLYTDTITDIADNAEATRLYANTAKYLGSFTFPALAKRTTNSTRSGAEVSIGMIYNCVGTTLYGILRTTLAFTPVSGAKYTLTLNCARD